MRTVGLRSLPGAVRAGFTAWLTVALAASLALTAVPARAANDSCNFSSRALTLSLPDIRPDQGIDTQVTGPAFQVGDCVPAVQMQVLIDNGHHAANGRRRMKHATREVYLPYTLSLVTANGASTLPSEPVRGPGRGRYLRQNLRLQIQGAALADLPAGDYSDCVTLSVTP